MSVQMCNAICEPASLLALRSWSRRTVRTVSLHAQAGGAANWARACQTTDPMPPSQHATAYLSATAKLAQELEPDRIDAMARGLAAVRERGGRLFILGVGGGAGHASHAVNDFRKLCRLESYAPTDNVSELTARTNDDGWETSFSAWLEVSRLSARDALLVFSVGGGSREHNVSTNLVRAMEAAHGVGASIYGVVGAPGGTLAELADVAILDRAASGAAHAAR